MRQRNVPDRILTRKSWVREPTGLRFDDVALAQVSRRRLSGRSIMDFRPSILILRIEVF